MPTTATRSDPQQDAADAGLRYVAADEPGLSRRRAGTGFSYRLPDGGRVGDARTLERIRSLAIPPAYTDVWICRTGNGHLQATGRDARHRKQYRYHPQWQAVRGAGKFDRLVAFAERLPALLRRLRADLAKPGFPRDKVLAIVVSLMADTLARIGNDEYARSNRSYGLTTLRNHHVDFLRDGRARLAFRGKGGKDHTLAIDDARLAKLVRACHGLPGRALFQYRDDDGALQPVASDDVNAYLREVMGEAFTAKDFRTWGATRLAFRRFATTPWPAPARGRDEPSVRALESTCRAVLGEVAEALGNTVAVCRRAYVDPVVVEAWKDGALPASLASLRGERQWDEATLRFLARRHGEARPKKTRAR